MKRVLIALPDRDFDPTEVAIPWRTLTQAGHEVAFATPQGAVSRADPVMVSGKGLGPLGLPLRADRRAREAYAALSERDPAFRNPLRYADLELPAFDALVLPGGHAPGMRSYLESEALQDFVARFMESVKPVGAICHGVVLAARSVSKLSGRSVLFGRKTTALPKWMELSAWGLTRSWMGDYYRTYPVPVQTEVASRLRDPRDFISGPLSLRRDSPTSLGTGFTVRDGNYLSARWPGDAHRFAADLLSMMSLR